MIKSETEGVGPFDFLFCKACDLHVGRNFGLRSYSLKTRETELSQDERRNRVAPVVEIKIEPYCLICNGPLIRKWVSVTITVPK